MLCYTPPPTLSPYIYKHSLVPICICVLFFTLTLNCTREEGEEIIGFPGFAAPRILVHHRKHSLSHPTGHLTLVIMGFRLFSLFLSMAPSAYYIPPPLYSAGTLWLCIPLITHTSNYDNNIDYN